MEDAVIHTLDIGDGNSIFAVFDGHGGKSYFIDRSLS
jgi:serine/threonine protein phosphatase PrpC